MVFERREEKGRRELRDSIGVGERFSPFSLCSDSTWGVTMTGAAACTSGSLKVAREAARFEVTGGTGSVGEVQGRGDTGTGELAERFIALGGSVCLCAI